MNRVMLGLIGGNGFERLGETFCALSAWFSSFFGHRSSEHGSSSVYCFVVDGNRIRMWSEFDVTWWYVFADFSC